MARKRPLNIAFPDLAHETSRMSWRTSDCPGDWTVKCGGKEFRVHRIVVTQGLRASAFLRANCNQSYEATASDISDLLPEPCWNSLEIVLDYLYGDDLPPMAKATDAVLLLKVADVLQIKTLYEEMMSRLNDTLEVDLDELPALLQLAWDMLPGPVAQGVLQQVARYFCLLSAVPSFASELRTLPKDALTTLLAHPDLKVRCEDDVFNFLTNHGKLTAAAVPWWSLIHFEQLSPHCAAVAQGLLESSPCDDCNGVLTELLLRRARATPPRGTQAHDEVTAEGLWNTMLRSLVTKMKKAATTIRENAQSNDGRNIVRPETLLHSRMHILDMQVYFMCEGALLKTSKAPIMRELAREQLLKDWKVQHVFAAWFADAPSQRSTPLAARST